MIVGAAFCPDLPLLVPALATGAAAELEELRAACAMAAYDAELCYDRAPYGVGYLVAAWTAHG